MPLFDCLNPLKNITPRFTDEQLYEINKWFNENANPLLTINDNPEPTNVITIEQLQIFLASKIFHIRSFHYPTYFEIMKEVEFLKAGVTRMLTKDQFIYMLNRWVIDSDMKHELKLAFKVFDTEKRNYLEIEELREIVTSYADPFDADEVIEFLRDVNVRGDGNVFYDDFIETMFSVAPELYKINNGYLYEDPNQDPSVAHMPPVPELEPAKAPLPPPPPPPPPPAPPAPTPPTSKGNTAKGKKK